MLIVFSFNNSRRGGNIIWKGFTTKYYTKAFGNEELMMAFANSLTIAVVSTIVSVLRWRVSCRRRVLVGARARSVLIGVHIQRRLGVRMCRRS